MDRCLDVNPTSAFTYAMTQEEAFAWHNVSAGLSKHRIGPDNGEQALFELLLMRLPYSLLLPRPLPDLCLDLVGVSLSPPQCKVRWNTSFELERCLKCVFD